jgi:phosphoglucomutase
MDRLAAVRTGFAAIDVDPTIKERALAFLATWLTGPEFAPYRPQLEWLIDQQQWPGLLDRFCQILPFGTGGRRGPVGIGPNRMNAWTLTASVQGHCAYLKQRFSDYPKVTVVIAYDVRRFADVGKHYCPDLPNPCLGLTSKELAKLAAQVYVANGIEVYLPPLDSPRYLATPELSFFIRQLGAQGGLNISASHNPADDNGGKFYDERGGQPVPPDDQIMADLVDQVATIHQLSWPDAQRSGRLHTLEDSLHREYLDHLARHSLLGPVATGECRIVYTPLHGVGGFTVMELLERQRYTVIPVAEQLEPNGLFPTVATANPEVPAALKLAQELAEKEGADLVLASDPDADRIGALVPAPTGWRFLNGNELAALLTYFKLEQLAVNGKLPRSPVVCCSLVTTSQIGRIGRKFGAQVVGDLLVGFKYVADVLYHLERDGRFRDVVGRPGDLVIATEESHGILVTAAIRDKDAGGGSLLMAELAVYQKRRGHSVLDFLDHMNREFGYFHNQVRNLVMTGILGKKQMLEMMASLRRDPPREIAGQPVLRSEDLLDEAGRMGPLKGATDAAGRNVVIYHLPGEARVVLRPSGTEPKAKAYIETCSPPMAAGTSPEVWTQHCAAVRQQGAALADAFVKLALGRVGL